MKDIYIVGASGFGREVAWLIEETKQWNIIGFIDDNEELFGEQINNYIVRGNTDYLLTIENETNVVVAIGNPHIRERVINKLKTNTNISFPNIIASDVKKSEFVEMGEGNIICSSSILTTNIKIGDFNHINLLCTVGHDVVLNDFTTLYPTVSVSGNVNVGNYCEFGTGTKIIQGKHICNDVITGAGAVVVKNIEEAGTYVGIPVKKISK